jgi:cardiolipin synthase
VPTIPNILTSIRILFIPVIIMAFYHESTLGYGIAAVCFIGACITDYLDGLMARLLSQSSKLGQFLDPTADKLLVVSTLFLLVGFNKIDRLSFIPAIIILCREVMVSGLREVLSELRISMPVTVLAKWKTTLQMLALSFLMVSGMMGFEGILHRVGEIMLWISALLTLVTGVSYVRAGLKHF